MLKKIVKAFLRIIFIPFILKDYFVFKIKSKGDSRFPIRFIDLFPQIKDKTIKTGFDHHYVYHTSWAARKVKEIDPEFHTDISSSLFFCGIVSAFKPVKFYDYRPADLNLSNLESKSGDLLSLPFADNEIKSLSCLHTIEHVGLGRYGDPIDPLSDIAAMKELERVLSVGGSLLFVTPVGKPKIEFNAHRIYSYKLIREYFKNLELVEFSLVTDAGEFINNATESQSDNQKYGCGCFWFKKKNI